MKRSEHRILTTHVGSIVRPKELLDLSKGPPGNQQQYEKVLREAIAAVVRQQALVGIDIVNEGEFSKESWANYVLKRMSGFEIRPDQLRPIEWLGRDLERFKDYFVQAFPRAVNGTPTEACVGPVEYTNYAPIRLAIDALQGALREVKVEEAFMTAVAPASTAYDGVNEYYSSEREYIFAIADALRKEYLEIHKAGLLVQVDDAVLANMYDALIQKSPQHYRKWAELRVEALNHALEGIPEDRVRYHVCFGSWHVPHVADAELEDIVDLILRVKAGAYSIEAANVRHEHEWKLWKTRKLPAGKILIPGIITHHTTTVEHPELVAERIVNFAGAVGKENLIAGTDCGFAQGETTQRVHPQVMWAKFESLAEGAKLASKQLWG
jgi:5-methyltetrahydropteroyltriglutamate--homocysteine methyltransferase